LNLTLIELCLGEFSDYKNTTGAGGNTPVKCSFKDGVVSTDKHACLLEESTMLNKPCSAQNDMFGYAGGNGKPCVLIKLNKVLITC